MLAWASPAEEPQTPSVVLAQGLAAARTPVQAGTQNLRAWRAW